MAPMPIAVVLWLAFFFPVGLNLLWRHTPWSLQTKQRATGATAIWVIICLISSASSPTPTPLTTPPLKTAVTATPKSLPKFTKTPAQQKASDAKAARAANAYDNASARAFARYKSDLKHLATPGMILGVDAEDPRSANVTVSNLWFEQYPGIKLQSAQSLYGLWLRDCQVPGNFPPGFKVQDQNGNILAETSWDGKLSVNKE